MLIAPQHFSQALRGSKVATSRKLLNLAGLTGRDRVFAVATGGDRTGIAFPRILKIQWRRSPEAVWPVNSADYPFVISWFSCVRSLFVRYHNAIRL